MGPILGIEEKTVRIDAQQMKDRGRKIARFDTVGHRIAALLVAGSEYLPAGDACPSQHAAKDMPPNGRGLLWS